MVEQDLIYLAACAVNRETPDPARVAAMELDTLYQLAAKHLLAATVAPALQAAGVQDERFSSALEHSAFKNATMDMEMDAMFAALDAAGIWHMPLKGIVLQHMYPSYGMRQMSDHDFLVDPDRMEDIRTIMEGLGFSVCRYDVNHHDVYHKEPVSNFEIHRSLFGEGAGQALFSYYQKIEDRLLGEGLEKRFSPEDFYLYMTAHTFKHYSKGGTGLRSVLDTYVYLQKESLDMAYVAAEAEKLGIKEFEAASRSLSQRLFSGAELTAADREMLDYILASGVYGNVLHRVENTMHKRGFGKIGYALNRFSVPFSRKNDRYKAFSQTYPVFYRHKLLLPLLPFYRSCHAMKSGRFRAEAKAIKKAKK